jgi:RHS repeat-associated protein
VSGSPQSGFQTTSDYILGPAGEQAAEMAMDANQTLTWLHTNVYAAGALIATYDATGKGLHFYFNDPLGTRRAQTDAAGVLEQTCASLPFGDALSCTGSTTTPTEHHFTGKERDTESGNDYFGARYFASSMGRFMSPDPKMASGHAVNPQTWNRYNYSLDNPLKFIDPDGKEAILFYRPPDPTKSSAKDFGHVFIYVRNDKTGREGFFDYYPDSGKSAVHRGVPASRIAGHAGLIIPSTPEAEDRMLNKMDALTKQNPPFNAGQGSWLDALWNVFVKKNVNDCVTTTEQILDAGGVQDSSSTPTGLWEDMYAEFSNDSDLDTDFGSQGQLAPQMNTMHGQNGNQNTQGSREIQEEAARQCALGNKAACD